MMPRCCLILSFFCSTQLYAEGWYANSPGVAAPLRDASQALLEKDGRTFTHHIENLLTKVRHQNSAKPST